VAETFVGAAGIEGTGGAVKVTVAVSDLFVSTADVALTVSSAKPSFADTVRRPVVLFMVVPLFLFVWTIDHVTVWTGLFGPATVAEKDWVLPFSTLAVLGLTVTELTIGVVTVTVAVPFLLVSAVDVALTVIVDKVSLADTVRRLLVLMVVPLCLPAWSIDHVTFWDGLLFPATVAEKDKVLPFSTVAVDGLTVTLETGGDWVVTVTTAVPFLLVSAVDVALTVIIVRVSLADTVRRPLMLMVVPLFLPAWSIDHVTFWDGLFVPATVAEKDWVLPFSTVAVAGLTVTLETGGGWVVTVTTAVPFLLVSAVDVALTVIVVRLSLADTVRRPLVLMVVPLCLPAWSIAHVTFWDGLLFPATMAEKDWVLPFSTLAVVGLTVTEVTVGVV
jgi:hypothetical protein